MRLSCWLQLPVVGALAFASVNLFPSSVRGNTGPGENEPPESLLAPLLQLNAPLPKRVAFRAGLFTMGSTPDEIVSAIADCMAQPLKQPCLAEPFFDEGPVRRVTLSAFQLDRYEVSVRDYRRCVSARRCRAVPYFRGARRFERDVLPVNLVRHTDAVRYCAFVGGRLPTEAEFERAARGTDRRIYPWGHLYNSRLSNHGKLSFSSTDDVDGHLELAPVRSFPLGATPEHVFNLAGNVAEWIHDRYAAEYAKNEQTDPRGPDAGSGATDRVVRGGSYASAAPWLRGAARDHAPGDTRSARRGFRCAYGSGGQSP